MTTLNPLSTVGTTAVVLQSDLNDDWTYMAGSGHYLTADLLAALDAVPKAPEQPPLADWERDLLGPQNDDGRYWHGRAMENLRKAELATTRAEKAEADHAATQKAYRDLGASHAKLLEQRDALAATVERVRHLRSVSGDTVGVEELDAALDPTPALPTEPGSLILLGDKPLCLNADGWWTGLDGGPFTAEYIESRDWKPAKVVAE